MKKKILIIFLTSLILFGCNKNNSEDNIDTSSKIPETIDINTADLYKSKLTSLGKDIYNKNLCTDYITEDNLCIINLKQMRDELKLDTSDLETFNDAKCDINKIQVIITPDGKEDDIIITLDSECIYNGEQNYKGSLGELDNTDNSSDEKTPDIKETDN